MSYLRESRTQKLVATAAVAIFIGLTVSAGLSQTANSSAAETYKSNCVACHGPDGRGSSVGQSLHVPDFHSTQVQQQSDAQLTEVITQGHGNMPPFRGRLSNDQINALTKYIRTFSDTK